MCTYLTSHSFFLEPFKSYLYGVWELRATILTLTQTKNGSANDLMMTLKLHFESHSIRKMSWHFSYYRIPFRTEKNDFLNYRVFRQVLNRVLGNVLKLKKVRWRWVGWFLAKLPNIWISTFSQRNELTCRI